MRVLVCGGRDFRDARFIWDTLNYYREGWPPDTIIIEGDAPGADREAGRWAGSNNLDHFKFPAHWDRFGKAAGGIRNQRMLTIGQPELVVAFPGGAGTRDMVKRAESSNVPVIHAK